MSIVKRVDCIYVDRCENNESFICSRCFRNKEHDLVIDGFLAKDGSLNTTKVKPAINKTKTK